MRRELRRHPVQGKQKPARPGQRTRATPTPGAGTGQRTVTTTASARSPLPAGGLRTLLRSEFISSTVSELKKVTWPTRQETVNLTMVVIVVAAALGLFLGGLDYGFNWLVENTLLR
jgi:preprotein translocase subunit SecE